MTGSLSDMMTRVPVPTLPRVFEFSFFASEIVSTQAKHIASLLHGLKRADRHHIVKIVEKIVLIAKGKIKIDT